MIKLQKTASYYKRGSFWYDCNIFSKNYYTLPEALEAFEAIEPRYYINNKDISVIESIECIYKIELGYKRYYKTIDPITEKIESNYKED